MSKERDIEILHELINTPSPSGFERPIAEYIKSIVCESLNEDQVDIDFQNNEVEIEWCLQVVSADVANLDTVQLRILDQDDVLNTYSSGNTFQNIQIPDEYINYLLKGKLMKKLLSIALPVLFLVAISSTICLWNIDLFGALLTMVFLSMGILLIIIMHYLSYKKMKKYPPNKIL